MVSSTWSCFSTVVYQDSSPRASRTSATVPVESRPWEFAGHRGQIITTPNYRLYTTMTRQSVLDRLPLFLERAMAHYTSALATLPEPGCRLYTFLV